MNLFEGLPLTDYHHSDLARVALSIVGIREEKEYVFFFFFPTA